MKSCPYADQCRADVLRIVAADPLLIEHISNRPHCSEPEPTRCQAYADFDRRAAHRAQPLEMKE